MKKFALVLAALAATSASAIAGDFAATLHYPEAPKSISQTHAVDNLSTGSIVRKPVVDGKKTADTIKAKKR